LLAPDGGPATVNASLGDRRGLAKQDLLRLFAHYRGGIDLLGPRISALHRFPFTHRLKPAFEVREVLKLLALPLVRDDPRIDGHVGYRIALGNKLAIRKPLVEHAIETVRLLDVPFDGVRYLLRRILREVMILTRHRAEIAHLPEQPFHHLYPVAEPNRQVLAGLLAEVQQDGT